MKTPILLLDLDTGELTPFDTLKEAQASVEIYDVDECRAFDAEGCVINISVVNQSFWSLGNVLFAPMEERDPETLRQALLKYLRRSKANSGCARSLKQHPELDENDVPLEHLVMLLVNWHREWLDTKQSGSFWLELIQALFQLSLRRKH